MTCRVVIVYRYFSALGSRILKSTSKRRFTALSTSANGVSLNTK